MTNADKLTPTQLRALADEKEAAIHKAQEPKPLKRGKLKHDLWATDFAISHFEDLIDRFLSKPEVDEIKRDMFVKFIDAGEVFDCYVEKDGKEHWYGIIDDCDAEWAAEHLTILKG